MPAVKVRFCLRLLPKLSVTVSVVDCDNIPKKSKFLKELSSFFLEQLALMIAKSNVKIILNFISFSYSLKSKKIESINFKGSWILLLNRWIFFRILFPKV